MQNTTRSFISKGCLNMVAGYTETLSKVEEEEHFDLLVVILGCGEDGAKTVCYWFVIFNFGPHGKELPQVILKWWHKSILPAWHKNLNHSVVTDEHTSCHSYEFAWTKTILAFKHIIFKYIYHSPLKEAGTDKNWSIILACKDSLSWLFRPLFILEIKPTPSPKLGQPLSFAPHGPPQWFFTEGESRTGVYRVDYMFGLSKTSWTWGFRR